MHGVTYLVAAYAIAWIGLFAYLAFLMMRVRSVRTELTAVTELVREQRERGNAQNNGHASWEAEKQSAPYADVTGEDEE
ncbi:MAG: CcmD family protein [Ktedonobacteraceae bacterium]|nr:CcmD family protein [Ktedonobacteraceae bacterium]MBV9711614.1 CcmD family protein [Ktedonobacteraceae bacterium]